jgi:transposase
MTISVLGIDLAKNTYQLHGVDSAAKAALKKRLSRNELATYIAGLPACRIVMEACTVRNPNLGRHLQLIQTTTTRTPAVFFK